MSECSEMPLPARYMLMSINCLLSSIYLTPLSGKYTTNQTIHHSDTERMSHLSPAERQMSLRTQRWSFDHLCVLYERSLTCRLSMGQNTPYPLHSLFCTGHPLFHENRQSPYAGQTPLSHWKYNSIAVQNVNIHSQPNPTKSVGPAQSTDEPPSISKAPPLLVLSCQDLVVPSCHTFPFILEVKHHCSHGQCGQLAKGFRTFSHNRVLKFLGYNSIPVPNSGTPTAGANRHDRGYRDNPLSMALFATILQFYTSSTSPHNAINNNACILQYRTPPQSSGSFKFFVAFQ